MMMVIMIAMMKNSIYLCMQAVSDVSGNNDHDNNHSGTTVSMITIIAKMML